MISADTELHKTGIIRLVSTTESTHLKNRSACNKPHKAPEEDYI